MLSNQNIVSKENYEIDRIIVGERIRSIRKQFKLTQDDLADIFNTTQSTVSAYESGKTLILTAFVLAMCKKLKISADYVIGRSNVIKTLDDNIKNN